MTLRAHLREEDFPARYGGEEFSVVLPAMGIDSAVGVAHSIHQAVGKLVLVKRSTKERLPGITISVGAASLRRGDSCDSLLRITSYNVCYTKLLRLRPLCLAR